MEVRILGAHAAEAGALRMTSLIIDGILALDAGGLTSSLSISEQQRIKAILLTHHHFDHSRDLVTFGANGPMFSDGVKVYALSQTLDIVGSCLLDGRMYVDFSKWPSEEKPFLQISVIEPFDRKVIEGYEVFALPVKHAVPSLGYQITSVSGESLFYSGDTGPGLFECCEHISPQLLIIEITGPNKLEDFYRKVGHLTPQLLKSELVQFRKIKGYFPQVTVIHMAPQYEAEIREEVKAVAKELGVAIDIGYEGMIITL